MAVGLKETTSLAVRKSIASVFCTLVDCLARSQEVALIREAHFDSRSGGRALVRLNNDSIDQDYRLSVFANHLHPEDGSIHVQIDNADQFNLNDGRDIGDKLSQYESPLARVLKTALATQSI